MPFQILSGQKKADVNCSQIVVIGVCVCVCVCDTVMTKYRYQSMKEKNNKRNWSAGGCGVNEQSSSL